MSTPAEDAERSAAHVMQWTTAASAALATEKLTATERARLGDLILSAATWLDQRAEKIAKAEKAANTAAFMASIANLPFNERMARIRAGK